MNVKIKCSYCSADIQFNAPDVRDNSTSIKVQCPKCNNVLLIKLFNDNTYGEVINVKYEPQNKTNSSGGNENGQQQ